jgi:S1-C subfamily serine protease
MRLAAILFRAAIAATVAVATSSRVSAQALAATDVFAKAREATWAVSVVRYTQNGQVEYAAFVGSGFFVSRNHFITAEHVVNARLLGRSRNMRDRLRVFKNSPYDAGFGSLKVVYEDAALDIAILETTLATQDWLTVSITEPVEGEGIGSYGYPVVDFADIQRATAFALGRLGMVAGYGRDSGARRLITTLATTTGNSGGPVFVMRTGHVVAVHKAQMTDSKGVDIDGYSMSTPLSAIVPQLQKLGIVK